LAKPQRVVRLQAGSYRRGAVCGVRACRHDVNAPRVRARDTVNGLTAHAQYVVNALIARALLLPARTLLNKL
jgi:hypothetical protein